MRMDRSETLTAHNVVERLERGELKPHPPRDYGRSDNTPPRIAQRNRQRERRKKSHRDHTLELVDVIKSPPCLPRRSAGKAAPGQASFQAIRIAVNDELGAERDMLLTAMRPRSRRREAVRHQLSLPGGSDRQDRHSASGGRLHLPGGISRCRRVRLRQDREDRRQAHHRRRGRAPAQPPQPQRAAARGGKTVRKEEDHVLRLYGRENCRILFWLSRL